MVGIIVASHGDFANGILQSASMILGDLVNVKACTIMPSEGPENIKAKMEQSISTFDDMNQVLFLVDLWSGTPFNQANGLFGDHKKTWAIVSGLNLPMLIEAISLREDLSSAQEIAKNILATARDEIKVLPETLEPVKKEVKASSMPQGKIPEGTVLGDGKIKYVLARVDTRLLHGQVASNWCKQLKPNRIIVVSDKVSKDALRKNMIEQVAPPGVRAHVVPIDKMAQVAKDTRFGNTRALILFETPEDALKAYEKGVKFETLNLGSIAHATGKVVITKVMSMDKVDLASIKKLMSLGVKMDVRKVPADSPENIDSIIKKAESELG